MRSPAHIRPISVAGPLLLLAVVGIIVFHVLRWHVVAEALGRRVRLTEIDGRFMDIELDRLQMDENLQEIPPRNLDFYWDRLQRLAAGTGREPMVRSSRVICLSMRDDRRRQAAGAQKDRFLELLGAGRTAEAAALVIEPPPELKGTEEWTALQRDARQSLLQKGWILLEAGPRTVGHGADRRTLRIRPALVASRPVPVRELDAFRRSGDKAGPSGSEKAEAGGVLSPDPLAAPATGVSLEEAQAYAASRGLRLLHLAEREILEESAAGDPNEATGTSSSSGAGPDLLEWILPEGPDSTLDGDLGWCAVRVHPPPENGHPAPAPSIISVRRRPSGRGYGDTTLRCALDVVQISLPQ